LQNETVPPNIIPIYPHTIISKLRPTLVRIAYTPHLRASTRQYCLVLFAIIKFMKKTEKDIYKEYLKYNHRRPTFLGKENHWRTHYEGYEVGHEDGVAETTDSWHKELGMNLDKFPINVDQQFKVMKKALQEYYKKQNNND